MAEQNLLLHLESDEVFSVAYETRQNSVSAAFENRPPMYLLQQTSLLLNNKLYNEATD